MANALFLVIDRGGQRFLDRPSMTIKALTNSCRWNAGALYPFSNSQGFTVQGELPTAACVSALLFRGSPSAVTRLIVAVIVNAVKLVFERWLKSHIGQEVFKAVDPTVTNLDTPPAPLFKARDIRCQAALLHTLPCNVLRAIGLLMCVVVYTVIRRTAAIASHAGYKGVSHFEQDVAAVTPALPIDRRRTTLRTPFKFIQHCQRSVSLACSIDEVPHLSPPMVFLYLIISQEAIYA